MPVTVTCPNCGKTKSLTPSRVKQNPTGLCFCNQNCWIEYRALHAKVGAGYPTNLYPYLLQYHEPMKRFLQNQPMFVRSRDIASLFSVEYPDFCTNMSNHAKAQQVGKIRMTICEPYSKSATTKHVALFKNPYAVKNREGVKV